ncbi:S8 family serine peptidase [Micromonospora tulbaghiae]|uniref:Subtilase family protein n=1 Tax=Micromonospora tulbaghiae TaxID=479978 RepID=A0ABY0KHJ9_9ACTN|nr:S8 family serine peptidase [Micromonospora tulbaghiae]MDX5459210.1 S8 family serine peptidase [Micromonospora tulbaghiae]SCE73869.1 Subtilase family protein [Micromonospora tulbaghiae]
MTDGSDARRSRHHATSGATLAAVVASAVLALTPLAPAAGAGGVNALAPAARAEGDQVKYYTVEAAHQGEPENLTEIAERFLGDGARAAELFALNTGRIQPDGATLTDGSRLRAGWVLVLPWDAYGGEVRQGVPPAAKPAPGASTPAGRQPAADGDAAVRPPKGCGTVTTSRATSSWAGPRVAADQAWPHSRGRDQLVAVVDSGVAGGLPSLAGRVTTGVDRATGGARGDADCLGTGTAMAGLIVAQPVKGSTVAGVAPDAAVMPVRVAGRTAGASAAASVAGIRAAAGSGASVIAVGPQVDLGQAEVVSAVNEAVDAGVVVVVGAASESAPPSPDVSLYDAVLRVGGIGADGGTADGYRSGGVDVVAPGVDVASLGITGARPVSGTGTHLAVAYVAGQAALIRSAFPDLDPAQVSNRVLKTAKTTGGVAPEIDLTASVTAVLPEEAPRAQAAEQAAGSTGIGRRAALLALAGLAALTALLLGLRARRSARSGAGRPEAAPAGAEAASPSVHTGRTDLAATRTDPAVAAPVPTVRTGAGPALAGPAVIGPARTGPAVVDAVDTDADDTVVDDTAPDDAVPAGTRPDVTAAVAELSRDPALRHLAADEAGMAYLAETRPEAREKALIGLVPGMDDETVAALPAMVTALPGTDEQEQSLTGVLVDVRRHLRGDPLALDRALVRAGKIRWQSQHELAEHVTSYAQRHPELARLATAIAETRWSSGAEEPVRGT